MNKLVRRSLVAVAVAAVAVPLATTAADAASGYKSCTGNKVIYISATGRGTAVFKVDGANDATFTKNATSSDVWSYSWRSGVTSGTWSVTGSGVTSTSVSCGS